MDLKDALPRLLPACIAWAEARAKEGVETGAPLTEAETAIARAVGVIRPALVRISVVEALPLPEEPELKAAAEQAGLLGPRALGLTLGHALWIRLGHRTRRVMSHELRHVYQYERAGGIAAFLPLYLRQVVEHGWERAPLEMEARAHELRDA